MGSSYGFHCEYQGRRRTIEQAGPGYFPESKDHLIAVAARIEAECDATMTFLLAEAFAGVESKMGDSDRGSSKGTGGL